MEVASGGAPSLGTLEDTLGKASLSMGAPFHLRGTWYVGGARILGTLIHE